MICLGPDSLADHHCQPARFGEQFLVLANDAPGAAKDVDLVRQAVRRFERPAIVPEVGVVALRRAIMQHQEVADIDVFLHRELVVTVDLHLVEAARRKPGHQSRDAGLDQVDAGGFKRLEESAGKADRDHVLYPGFPAMAGEETERARVGQRLSIEVREQGRQVGIL